MGNQISAKSSMNYASYHRTHHNVETCRSKKEEFTIIVAKAIALVGKPPRPLNYPCHVCGIM